MEKNSKKIIPPEHLISGYAKGIFPMSESRNDPGFQWYTARRRGIIPIDKFRVSGNVERIIRQGRYKPEINRRFKTVMEECASRESTWISDLIIHSYVLLHEMGYAHSVEMLNDDGTLAGGLYGVAIGSAFFGESMFKHDKEADKVALWHCHQILQRNGFELWDTQYYTDHLAQFGCVEIPGNEYMERLEKALKKEVVFEL
jgi:leucyl/phenylalanyl-tRNA---protein transferase